MAMESVAVEGQASGLAQSRSACIDITVPASWRRAEIKTTCAFLENIIDSSADPIWIDDDGHGHFTKWNQAAAEIFGYRAENSRSAGLPLIYMPIKRPWTRCWANCADGLVRGYEIDIQKRTGPSPPSACPSGCSGMRAEKARERLHGPGSE